MAASEPWKRNLWILWVGNFFVMAGMNLIIPFLPLYVYQLGVHDVHLEEQWSGMIFAGTPLLSALVSPLWGRLSDVYGRKMMLVRSSIGMAIVMALMGLAQSPLHLLILRLLMGTVSGFIPSSVSLQAAETPKEHAGRALGLLQTGGVAGSLIGPLIGGVLSEWLGIRNVFYFTGALLMIAGIVVIFGVHESRKYQKFSFRRQKTAVSTTGDMNATAAAATAPIKPRGIRYAVQKAPMILSLFFVSFLIMGSIQSIEPVITVYVQTLHVQSHLAIVSGIVYAANGVGTILAAPFLGRIGDRIGNQKVLMFSLLMMAVFYIPQAFVHNPWEIMALRLTTGLCVGGLLPSVNALLRKISPSDAQGVVFGFNQMSTSLGAVLGPNFGGFIASHYGIPHIFFFSSGFFILNLIWLVFQLRHNRKTMEAI